jgi:hypothetical protein
VPIGQCQPDAAHHAYRRIQQEILKATTPHITSLATAEFATLRLRLLKVAAPKPAQ